MNRVNDQDALLTRFERFSMDWRRILLRGSVTLILGGLLAIAALFKPDTMLLHARDFSWLPAAGFVVLAIGLLECMDAAIAREPADFFLHLQNGILDAVVGALIVFSISGYPSRLSLLIAGFLLVRGILRMVLVRAARLQARISAFIGGGISASLGLLIWAEWPSDAAWFLAFCLAVEIALRGLALITVASWRRSHAGDATIGTSPS